MKNQKLYEGALAILGERGSEEQLADYADRAPYILANFISENTTADRLYRKAHGFAEASVTACDTYADLSEDFPLCSRFAAAARLYLAAMLIDSEDSDRSDLLFDRYCKTLAATLADIPALREKILNCYQ